MKALAVILVMLMASTAFGVGSHRSLTPATWSYVQDGPDIDIAITTSLDVDTFEDHGVATITVSGSAEFDLFLEHSFYTRGLKDVLFKNDFGRGEPYLDMWGWSMVRRYSHTYADEYTVSVPFYVTNGMDSFIALGDVVSRFRFQIRYLNGSQLVQSGWYRPDPDVHDVASDTSPPEFTSVDHFDAINFSFGSARSLIRAFDLQCVDTPTGYNYAYMTRAKSRLTGTYMYPDASSTFTPSSRGRCVTGSGLISSTFVVKFTVTLQQAVAAGDYIWDCEIILWDSSENCSDWIEIGTVDLRDFD